MTKPTNKSTSLPKTHDLEQVKEQILEKYGDSAKDWLFMPEEMLKLSSTLERHGIKSYKDLELALQPSYFAIIPLSILEDKELTPNAKLLYAEITALSKKSGYCFATNKYLGERMGLSSESITGILKVLKDRNLIKVELQKNTKGTTRTITGQFVNGHGSVSPPTPASLGNRVLHYIDINKEKLIKEEKSIQKVFNLYKEKIQEKAKLTVAASDKIKTRLKTYSFEALQDAIDKFSKNDWWMENNASRGPVWFFSSDNRIDGFTYIEPTTKPKFFDFRSKVKNKNG